MNEEDRKRLHQSAVIPPLCFDNKQRRYKFINNNGYIQDPIGLFKSKHNQVFWCEKEREIFLEKLLLYGKNFELIASFLEKKVNNLIFSDLMRQNERRLVYALRKFLLILNNCNFRRYKIVLNIII